MTFAKLFCAVALLAAVATAHTYATYGTADCSGNTLSSTSGPADSCQAASVGSSSSKWTAAKAGFCFTICVANSTVPCDSCAGSGSTWTKYVCNQTSKFTQTVSCTDSACSTGCTTSYAGYNFTSATACPAQSTAYATYGACNFIQTFTAGGDKTCTTATTLTNLVCDKCIGLGSTSSKVICAGFVPSALALVVLALIAAFLSM